jgi:hypothetical protein
MDSESMSHDARGPFDSWYDAAGVRNGPRRRFHDETSQGKVFFPADLVPYLSHEAIRELPPDRQRELSVRHLYQFLLSTAHLETRVVNRGAERIANNRMGVDLPMHRRLDAFKVYCDEGYHSLYSLDLADQIAASTGIAVPDWDYGGFVARLAETGRRLLPDEPVLAQLLQVIVFETLITAVLNEVPNNAGVVTAVRDIVRDHARDEGRHHRFFAALFHELWAQLTPSLRTQVAFALPALIHSCLTWDLEPVQSSLLLAGVPEGTARAVVDDCYRGTAGTQRIRDIARATVRMCESAGVFGVPGADEAFAAHGLDGAGASLRLIEIVPA